MQSLWLYVKAVVQKWWAFLSCAVFTGISLYVLVANKSNKWAVTATFIAAAVMFVIANYSAWLKEHTARLAVEAKLDEKQKVITKQAILGGFLLEGKQIRDSAEDISEDELRDKIKEWGNAIVKYLMKEKEMARLARFMAQPAQPIKENWTIHEREQLKVTVEDCMDVLRDFITELNP